MSTALIARRLVDELGEPCEIGLSRRSADGSRDRRTFWWAELDGRLAIGRGLAAVEDERRPRRELATEDEVGQRVLEHALDRAAQRPRAHGGVVAGLDEELACVVGQLDQDVVLAHLL